MKKVIFSFVLSLFLLGAFAQSPENANRLPASRSINSKGGVAEHGWTSQIPQGCFCCNNKIFNLPNSVAITGPTSVSIGESPQFCIDPCPDANITWQVVSQSGSSIPFSVSGSCITIKNMQKCGIYYVRVQIRCGEKVVKGETKFEIAAPQNCNADFSWTQAEQPDGSIIISTIPSMQIPGQEHLWGIQYNGDFPNCNECVSIPLAQMNSSSSWGGVVKDGVVIHPYMGTGLSTGDTPYGIKYQGFVVNKCARITHYVNCCGVWKRTTYCFQSTGAVHKMASPNSPSPSKPIKINDEGVN